MGEFGNETVTDRQNMEIWKVKSRYIFLSFYLLLGKWSLSFLKYHKPFPEILSLALKTQRKLSG